MSTVVAEIVVEEKETEIGLRLLSSPSVASIHIALPGGGAAFDVARSLVNKRGELYHMYVTALV